MRSSAYEVMALQDSWSDKNTHEMQRRGIIIRNEIPAWLQSRREKLKEAMGSVGSDFAVEGRDGTGRKTEIPWVRFYSEAHSKHATDGWYCVYLFDAAGEAFYLALAHGSTRFVDGEFKPRSNTELQSLVAWASGLLGNELTATPKVVRSIDLGGKTKLSPAYARSTVAAIRYTKDNLPDDQQFLRDAVVFAALLGKIYEAQDLGRAPEAAPPELAAALQALDEVSNPLKRRKGGQGFGLSAQERKAVELHAMGLATKHLSSHGYEVKDVSGSESFDLQATDHKGGKVYVEVKGTTAGPDSIVLTSNEVALHKRQYPNTALIVVHGISLERSSKPPLTSGGMLLVLQPWKVEEDRLTPLSYRYELPVQ